MSQKQRGRRPKFTDKELIQLFRDSDQPVLTSNDITEAFDISQQGAYKRLQQLYDEGVIGRRKVGSSAVVWWLVDQSESVEAAANS